MKDLFNNVLDFVLDIAPNLEEVIDKSASDKEAGRLLRVSFQTEGWEAPGAPTDEDLGSAYRKVSAHLEECEKTYQAFVDFFS